MIYSRLIFSFFCVYAFVFQAAGQKSDSAAMAEIANKLSFSPVLKKGQVKLEPHVAPKGYRIDLIGTDRTPVIAKDGTIARPLVSVDVNLLYQLVREQDLFKLNLPTVNLQVPGRFDQNTGNSKPFVIPALQEWYGGKGTFKIKKHSRIVIPDQNPEIRQVGELLKKDLQVYGFDLEMVTGKTRAGDISLSLNTADRALGEEGYHLLIDHDALAQKIAGNIIGRQRRIAEYLNGKAKNIPAKVLLFTLIWFCTVFGAYCIYLLMGALN